MFHTPVLFLVFNRLDTTAKVLSVLKKLQPARLFIAADGPRETVEGELQKCEDVKALVKAEIDWDCELLTLFRVENLGCGLAVSSAITWFFSKVDRGIILEDDTVPSLSFFRFCNSMLDKYCDDDNIMHISGSSYANPSDISASYYFSKLPFIWGWATWKRAWDKYDYSNKYIQKGERDSILNKNFSDDEIFQFWSRRLQDFVLTSESYTWDYQWFVSVWKNDGLVVQPRINLVQNVGFGKSATHTKNDEHYLGNVIAGDLNDIVSPDNTLVNTRLQSENFEFYFKGPQAIELPRIKILVIKFINVFDRTIAKIKRLINNAEPNAHKGVEKIIGISEKSKIYMPFSVDDSFIDDYTYVSTNSKISISYIGKFCSIGPNFLCGWGIHPLNGISTSPMFYSIGKQNGYSLTNIDKVIERKKIVIGHDVFIGANVTVLDGVTIGNGAVIGAGAVVVKDVPPYAVVGGVPSEIIRYRFDEKTIVRLLNIEWWHWPEEKLHLVEKYFFAVDEFVFDEL